MYYNDNYVKSCEKGAVHMIVTVTLNPAVDKVARLDAIREYEINRLSKVESDAGARESMYHGRLRPCIQFQSRLVF